MIHIPPHAKKPRSKSKVWRDYEIYANFLNEAKEIEDRCRRERVNKRQAEFRFLYGYKLSENTMRKYNLYDFVAVNAHKIRRKHHDDHLKNMYSKQLKRGWKISKRVAEKYKVV